MANKNHITSSSTGLRNVCTFPAKTRSKVANITSRGELGVRCHMADIPYQGSKVLIGGKEIDFKFDLLNVQVCQNIVVVLIDPDSYIGKENIEHNLLGFDFNGNKLWEADYPQSYKSDYYWKIDTNQGLSASTLSSYNCEFNPLTGKIQRANFYK